MAGVSTVQPIIVRRYAGSRLYDATNLRYVAAGQLREWAAEGIAFSVVDAGTGLDVTRLLVPGAGG